MKRITEALHLIADIADTQRDAAEAARSDSLEIKLMLREVLGALSNIERDLETHKKSTQEQITALRKNQLNGSTGIHQ